MLDNFLQTSVRSLLIVVVVLLARIASGFVLQAWS